MRRITNVMHFDNADNSSLTIQGWFTTKQLADYLGTTVNAVNMMRYRRLLVPKKWNGRLRYRKEEIDRLIQSAGGRLWQ